MLKNTPLASFFISLGKVGCDKLWKRIDSSCLVSTVGNEVDSSALNDAQRENAEQALGIDTSVFLLDPDAAFELVCFLNKESSRSCVQAHLIVNNYFFGYHSRHSSWSQKINPTLANYLKNVIPSDRPYTFDEGTYYDDFVVKTSKLKHNNYPIIGKNDICKGLIRITEITDKRRKKVILVDHNELEQSAEGLEEADIIEIVDHHKIGNISTKNPINFRNMSVGCTNTIIY